MKLNTIFLKATLALALVSGANSLLAAGPKGDSVIDVARAVNADTGLFDTLLFALEATGLDDVLDNRNGQVTVFAPTDDAFANLPEGVLAGLIADPAALENVLLYHVAKGRREAADVIESDQIRMFNRDFIGVYVDGSSVMLVDNEDLLPDATVIIPNVPAANGVIHVIDEVLVP